MPHSALNLPAPLFLPLAAALGWAGTRTALHFRKLWGHGRRKEIAMLVLLAWLPLLIWFLARLTGATD